MSSIFGGIGGYAGKYDQDLQAKIDQVLAGKQSKQDAVADFLKKDLGIDPGSLPMTAKQARIRLNDIMQERTAASCIFTGNSLGIKHVQFVEQQNAARPCVTCQGGDVYDKSDGSGMWFCYDCDADYTPAPLVSSEQEITQNSKDKDWSDMMRAYKALQKSEDYSFSVDYQYTYSVGTTECGPIQVVHHQVEPDPRFLSVGLTVRLRKRSLAGEDEFTYAKKGGLFNDSDVVRLPSMEVISDIEKWTVVEIL